MNRTSVTSSNISSIGYDEINQILEVEFLHGDIYQYLGVPMSKYNELMNADSHGTYLNQNIKPFYPFSKK